MFFFIAAVGTLCPYLPCQTPLEFKRGFPPLIIFKCLALLTSSFMLIECVMHLFRYFKNCISVISRPVILQAATLNSKTLWNARGASRFRAISSLRASSRPLPASFAAPPALSPPFSTPFSPSLAPPAYRASERDRPRRNISRRLCFVVPPWWGTVEGARVKSGSKHIICCYAINL